MLALAEGRIIGSPFALSLGSTCSTMG